MQIGFSLVDLALGGAQTFMVQLAAGLAGRGHQLCYYLSADPADPVRAVPALLSTMDEAARRVRRPAELGGCAVIHLDGYHNLRRKLAYLSHWGRCVETYHSLYSVRRSGPFYPPFRVAVSRQVQAALNGAAQVIYQGIPLPPPPSAGPRPYEVSILGRLHPVKGHLLFFQACEALYRERGSLSVLVIGGHPQPGPYQRRLDAEIERLRTLGLSIQVTGDIEPGSVFDWLARAQVCLISSKDEGFGRMAVEALACGTVVVANPAGGLQEIIREGETGFLARRDDPTSFAALAAQLLEDGGLRERMGRQGRREMEQNFSLDRMLDEYEALYRRVAGI
jgi:glycosyltransferase involved in cell wall biosynthesis